jgi:hypothetical protein
MIFHAMVKDGAWIYAFDVSNTETYQLSKNRLQNYLQKSRAFRATGSPPSEAKSEVEQAQRLPLCYRQL